MTILMDSYDAALFDLDGVVYRGPGAVDGAPECIAMLRERGDAVGFVTNNAARSPQTVADHLTRLGIASSADDVVTSGQVTAQLLAREMPASSPVLVVGTDALVEQVRGVGMTIVESANDNPMAVVQGYGPQMAWSRIDEASIALQRGARWFVTNTDINRPIDRGLVPGTGAQVAAVAAATDVVPLISGKPYPPLLTATVERLGVRAPIFVGDRIDTDIKGAATVGMDSLFVFTGTHGVADLAAAGPDSRPTHLGWDLRALLDPVRAAEVTDDAAICRAQRAVIRDGRLEFPQVPDDREAQLDLAWAALQLVWTVPGVDHAALDDLTQLH